MSHLKPLRASWPLLSFALLAVGCAEPVQSPAATEVAADAAPAALSVVEISEPQADEPSPRSPDDSVQPVSPQTERTESIALAEPTEPQGRTAFYRADTEPAEVPRVLFSKAHEALCRVNVGDTMPAIELPELGANDSPRPLQEYFGEEATVVVFWESDRRMALEQLSDLKADVISPFGDQGVAVVGIVVENSPRQADDALQVAQVDFPNLLDADGQAFAKVGSEKLPRTYLLGPDGKIIWFDIEYSLATRRELHQAIRAVLGDPPSAGQ